MRGLFYVFCFTVLVANCRAQYIYFKNPGKDVIRQFNDSAKRVLVLNPDSTNLVLQQFSYVLKFYPTIQLKSIQVKYTLSKSVSKTKVGFSSIFKAPGQRIYTVYLSKSTKSTLDSVVHQNLSFNSQVALVAHQVSVIEDLSTGGFFNFIGWYIKHLSHRGKKRLYQNAEEKTLEVGLGYQLLSYNEEIRQRLAIDNWQNTKGYATYLKNYKDLPMKKQLIINLMNDLPVYMAHSYK